MRIGINILYLIPGKVGGTETYARELISRMSVNNEIILYCGKEARTAFTASRNLKIVTLPFHSSNRVARIIVEQLILPFICVKHQISVLLSLGYSAPLIHFQPSIVTIHDLNWYYHPEDFTRINLLFWKLLTIASSRFSNHIITDSSASANSIKKVLNIHTSKITPILHGTPTITQVKAYKSKAPYIFTVLANYPHKNLDTLLRSFANITKAYPKLSLIICGLGKQGKSTSKIKYLGYVTRSELCSLYKGAEIFVFPSAYEGFGYPVLEAMSYGVPVLSSNAYSLKEVVGKGGILIDPYDVNAYTKNIKSILNNKSLRNKLINQGKKRCLELKWDNTVLETMAVIHRLLQ